MYKNLTYESTAALNGEEWQEMRKSIKTVGGSDAATIIGLNPYSSPYALWCEKTGKITPEDLSDKEAVRLGHDLEDYCAKRFEEREGKAVRRRNAIIRNPELPFAHANVDRLIVGEDAGLECKTTSSWEIAAECSAGKVPKHYYVQCVHYMMVTGAAKWYLAVLCFGRGFYIFCIERDEAEIKALESAEREFYGMVENNAPPALDGTAATTEAVQTIFRESAPGTSIDLTAVGTQVETYNNLGRQIKELEAMQDEAANIIKEFMGECERGSYGNTTISWKSSERKTFDKAAYEAAMGVIPAQYYKKSSTRSFRVNVKKGA